MTRRDLVHLAAACLVLALVWAFGVAFVIGRAS